MGIKKIWVRFRRYFRASIKAWIDHDPCKNCGRTLAEFLVCGRATWDPEKARCLDEEKKELPQAQKGGTK